MVMVKRSTIKGSALILLLSAGVITLAFTNQKSAKVFKLTPKIFVADSNADLGTVEQGDSLKHSYIIQNVGNDILRIDSIKPSCGCTVASISTKQVPPFQSAELKVTFNSSGRAFAEFEKSVVIISNASPTSKTLRFHGRIVMPSKPHNVMMSTQNIFSGSCAVCHVDQGRGQIGKPLYDADCAICHGAKKDGKPSHDLLTMTKDIDEKRLFEIILNGKQGTNMPGFDWEKGGPLTDQEIKTLCQYIKIERSKFLSSELPQSHQKEGRGL
jgi:mono/diheme cytochrome c family protein